MSFRAVWSNLLFPEHPSIHYYAKLLWALREGAGFGWIVFADIFFPHGWLSWLRKPIEPVATRHVGDAMLCSLCEKIFRRRPVHQRWRFWEARRHRVDLPHLQVSAQSGCHICIRLLAWVLSIEDDPNGLAPFGRRIPNSFVIRSQLLATSIPSCFEIIFTIFKPGSRLNWTSYAFSSFEPLNPNFHRLTLRLLPANEVSPFKSKFPISYSTTSDDCWKLVKVWLAVCDEHPSHHRCQRQRQFRGPSWRPTRLINVGTHDLTVLPHLCESTAFGVNQDTRYLTLSHCWGKEPIFGLRQDNLEALQQLIPIYELPQSFRDAISVARALEIRYLWIDSLCIIQDSESDWAKEAATMGDVYMHSYCNIAATAFPDKERSLFDQRQRDSRFLSLPEIQVRSKWSTRRGVPPGAYICIDDFWQNEIVDALLNQRAWVLQERSLASRVLNFGTQQLLWECMELQACESFQAGIPPSFLKTRDFKFKKYDPMHIAIVSESEPDVLEAWCELASVYSTCQLTRARDKLVAISGLAARMYQAFPARYLAGIWESGLPHQLMWMVLPVDQSGTKRQENYRAPSWSWASLDRSIAFVDPRGKMTPMVQILSTNTEVFNGQIFGQVRAGYIRLKGYMIQAEFTEPDDVLSGLVQDSHRLIRFKTQDPESDPTETLVLIPDVYPEDPPNDDLVTVKSDIRAIGNRRFYLLFLAYTRDHMSGPVDFVPEANGVCIGLILLRSGANGHYQRVGLFVCGISAVDGDVLPLLASRKPALNTTHYEEYDEESGQSTIILV